MAEDREAVPEWFDKSFIQTALRRGMKNPFLEIVEYKLAPGAAVGDHYASQMLRATSIVKKEENGKQENLKFIIKLFPNVSTEASDFFTESFAFEKEGRMFCEIIPELNKMLKKAYPEEDPVAAFGYGYEKHPNHAIFLEDLMVSGYEKVDRFSGLDWSKTKLALNVLAKYHASSYIFLQDKPEIKEFFNVSLWNPKNPEFVNNMLKNAVRGLSSQVQSWEDFPKKEEYRRKLKDLELTILEKTQKIYRRNDSHLNVLLHGDCWISNYMFRFDKDRNATSAKMVDLQFVTYSAPVLDIIHFIFTSACEEIRFGDPDRFLRHYHECFMNTLKYLNFDLQESFTLKDLKEEYSERFFYALTIFCFIFPFTQVPQNEVLEVDAIMREGGGDGMYANDVLANAFKKAFPFFEKHGVF